MSIIWRYGFKEKCDTINPVCFYKYWNDIAFTDWMLFSERAWLLLLGNLHHSVIFSLSCNWPFFPLGPLSSGYSSKITRSVDMLFFISWFSATCFERPCMVVVRLILHNMNTELILFQLHLLESAEVMDYEALEDLLSEEVVSVFNLWPFPWR